MLVQINPNLRGDHVDRVGLRVAQPLVGAVTVASDCDNVAAVATHVETGPALPQAAVCPAVQGGHGPARMLDIQVQPAATRLTVRSDAPSFCQFDAFVAVEVESHSRADG